MQSNREIIIKALRLASMKVKVAGTWTNGVIEEQFGDVADEILSALKSNNDPQPPLPQAVVSSSAVVEVCYRWPGGREEVRYRRTVGTADANDLIAEVDEMQSKQGDKCPYFYRIAG